jgi:putative hydrolase of HD superfamily
MTDSKLTKQIQFIAEIDRLKRVYRQTFVTNTTQKENDAEHSWHLALMAVILADHAADKSLDILRVIKMALIHDLVEIDAGDTFCYDENKRLQVKELEKKAADRIFGMLPHDQADEMKALWNEFEARATPEAAFAASLDRLQPIMQNHNARGGAWKEHSLTSEQVLSANAHIKNGAPDLWEYAKHIISDAVEQGWLSKDSSPGQ